MLRTRFVETIVRELVVNEKGLMEEKSRTVKVDCYPREKSLEFEPLAVMDENGGFFTQRGIDFWGLPKNVGKPDPEEASDEEELFIPDQSLICEDEEESPPPETESEEIVESYAEALKKPTPTKTESMEVEVEMMEVMPMEVDEISNEAPKCTRCGDIFHITEQCRRWMKECNFFHSENGFCKHGSDCFFAHEKIGERPISKKNPNVLGKNQPRLRTMADMVTFVVK